MIMNDIEWLATWYGQQCDGSWEHQLGVKIETIDNPGWWVTIDLVGTSLESRSTAALLLSEGEPPIGPHGRGGGERWLLCEIKDGKFSGAGDPTRLASIINEFRSFAEDKGV